MSTQSEKPRLIEVAFPLKQASIDSVHEKNVRHGHISTLHIWPARRPLAASRAALIATLLPDPGNEEERKALLEKIGGKVNQTIERKRLANGRVEEKIVEKTEGGILHWGRETENKNDLDWFRMEIRKAYGGRAPKVLDPFAGGGAIPLEAMRLGCEATAVDINPVAWLILKCTLGYPQQLAGQKLPLPEFVRRDRDFMEAFFKAQGYKGKRLSAQLERIGLGKNPEPQMEGVNWDEVDLQADLAWQVRAWGQWVLRKARKELASFYPIYADFEPIDKRDMRWEHRDMRLVPFKEDGTPDIDALNNEFDTEYLKDKKNPRWVAKPTVAYLWARTVKCKNCRATVPLLKTRWLSRTKSGKRVVLTMEPNAERTGVEFGVLTDVPIVGGNTTQRRDYDKQVGAGNMSRSGATCPCCRNTIMTMEDIRLEGQTGRLGAVITAVIIDGLNGKEYRLPTEEEKRAAIEAESMLAKTFNELPFGLPKESLPLSRTQGNSGFRVILYGMTTWGSLFVSRQLLALGTFAIHTRAARNAMICVAYSNEWIEAIDAYLALTVDRLADSGSSIAHWQAGSEFNVNTFQRFALPMSWDFAEVRFTSGSTGSYQGALNWVALAVAHFTQAALNNPSPTIVSGSATRSSSENEYDIIVTDPPYYDAIAYSDVMDFFYVWLRRVLYGASTEIDEVFKDALTPKWDHDAGDGELIDDSSRFGGDKSLSKSVYENGMSQAFQSCHKALVSNGRLVIVFAHKHPNAWETLVAAIIRAGFVVDASYPIQTERAARTNALSTASLASSVWLVCRKRPETARPGWDNRVLDEMREKIAARLHDFWDAGVRGPDFVWAATGPALEAFSKHPVVKKANEPGQLMTVSEFLRHVRRMVVDFVVGRVLTHGHEEEAVTGLDDVTTYYLLHRHDFKMDDAPVGASILYAVSCNLSDSSLADQYDILARTGGKASAEEDGADELEEDDIEVEADSESEEGTGSKVKLKQWHQRKRRNMGYEAPGGRLVPLIDQVHRLMHLWRAGDVNKVNEYLDSKGLRQNKLFHQLLQALIELSPAGSEERSLLESISNHVAVLGVKPEKRQMELTTL